MMNPAIVPIKPGEIPTEPGFYVLKNEFGYGNVVEIALSGNVVFLGCEMSETVEDIIEEGQTFVARVYPDRIGEE